jgi:hypothetical protein
MQSVPITTNVVKSSSTIGRWFSPGTPFSSTNKADRHDITEILLKVALNTIILILIRYYGLFVSQNDTLCEILFFV